MLPLKNYQERFPTILGKEKITRNAESAKGKRRAVLLATTGNQAFAAGNVLIGLQKHSPTFADEVFIYHDGNLPENDEKALHAIHPNVHCVTYEPPKELEDVWRNKKTPGYPMMVFARFEMFDLLKRFHSVLYLDTDILIQKDISGIMNYGPFGARLVFTLRHRFRENYVPQVIERYPILSNHIDDIGYNAGVMLITDEFPYEGFATYLYQIALANVDALRLPVESTLGLAILLHLHSGKYSDSIFNPLPNEFNSFVNSRAVNAKIVHATSGKKFWNDETRRNLFPEWMENNMLYLHFGGTEYQKNGRKLEAEIKAKTQGKRWKLH